MRRSTEVTALVIGFSVFAAGTVFASHGKPGLWEVNMMVAGQNSRTLPPATIEQLKASGLIPNASGGFTIRRCMTAAEVNDDSKMINTSSLKDCHEANRKIGSHVASADLVCDGQMSGTGHVSVSYDTNTHYTGELKISGTGPNGTLVQQDQTFDGRWVSADCGSK